MLSSELTPGMMFTRIWVQSKPIIDFIISVHDSISLTDNPIAVLCLYIMRIHATNNVEIIRYIHEDKEIYTGWDRLS